MARKQVPFRLDPEVDRLFEAAVAEGRTTKQHVLEVFVENYCKHHRTGSIVHLNGTICPVSAMLAALADGVRLELEQSRLKV